jgi:hypothetical protein
VFAFKIVRGQDRRLDLVADIARLQELELTMLDD